jgi:hypothetical protein
LKVPRSSVHLLRHSFLVHADSIAKPLTPPYPLLAHTGKSSLTEREQSGKVGSISMYKIVLDRLEHIENMMPDHTIARTIATGEKPSSCSTSNMTRTSRTPGNRRHSGKRLFLT